METYILQLSQATSQVSLSVMFFYFGIFPLTIIRCFTLRLVFFG